jgi:hypothetical protein
MISTAMMAIAYATGRASHARQVKGDDPDKKEYPCLPGWELGVRQKPHPIKENIVTKPQRNRGGQGLPRAVAWMMMMIIIIIIMMMMMMIRRCHYQMVQSSMRS